GRASPPGQSVGIHQPWHWLLGTAAALGCPIGDHPSSPGPGLDSRYLRLLPMGSRRYAGSAHFRHELLGAACGLDAIEVQAFLEQPPDRLSALHSRFAQSAVALVA